MKLAIMQPYFFPYIGYWQLINSVDKFVIFDDVNFIKRGWINRNKILVNEGTMLINLKMQKASQNKLINEIELLIDPINNKKLLKTIKYSYKKAPYYKETFPIIESIITQKEENLAKYLEFSIRKICRYLSINTKLILSSSIDKNSNFKGQAKIIDLCKVLGADEYYNPIGGQELYSYNDFKAQNIELKFLKTHEIKYKQFKNEFISNLSIIDIMMFNSSKDINRMLLQYDIIE